MQVDVEGMLNADIATLQIVATLLAHASQTDHLLALVLHRFTLSDAFNWGPAVHLSALGQ